VEHGVERFSWHDLEPTGAIKGCLYSFFYFVAITVFGSICLEDFQLNRKCQQPDFITAIVYKRVKGMPFESFSKFGIKT